MAGLVDRRALLKQMAALGLAVPAVSVERTYFFGPWAPEQPLKLWGDAVHDDPRANVLPTRVDRATQEFTQLAMPQAFSAGFLRECRAPYTDRSSPSNMTGPSRGYL